METDIRSADIALIETEVEFRLEAKLEQVQTEAEEQRVRDRARIEREAATRLEPAVAKARVAGEAAALEAMAAEVERVRREADEQRAAEVTREREQLAGHRDAALGQQVLGIAKTETEAMIEPDSVTDDFGLESVSGVAGHVAGYRRTLPAAAPT